MAKNNKIVTEKGWGLKAVILALILVLIPISKSGSSDFTQSILGFHPSPDYSLAFFYIISSLGFLLIISLLFGYRSMTWQNLGRLLGINIAAFLFVFGWKLTSIGYGGTWGQQNDGYSVTGGFMMFFSGLYFGYLVALSQYQRLIKNTKGSKNG